LVPELAGVVEVAAGNHSAALDENGHLYLWGQGSFGNVERPSLFSERKFQRVFLGGPTGAAID
jgi:alpha-tubulin suppressor-like RCC1 family protein